jgi:hypothetical protein
MQDKAETKSRIYKLYENVSACDSSHKAVGVKNEQYKPC